LTSIAIDILEQLVNAMVQVLMAQKDKPGYLSVPIMMGLYDAGNWAQTTHEMGFFLIRKPL